MATSLPVISPQTAFQATYGAFGPKEEPSQAEALGNKITYIASRHVPQGLQATRFEWHRAATQATPLPDEVAAFNHWLQFDESGLPKFIPWTSFFRVEGSDWEQLVKEYRFFRGEDLRELYAKISALVAEENETLQFFLDRPLGENGKHPLEDLQERARRVEWIHKQLKALEFALASSGRAEKAFIANLSPFRRALFHVASLFHSIFTLQSRFNLEKTPFPRARTTLDGLINQTFLLFQPATLEWGGKTFPVAIKVRLMVNAGETAPQGPRLTLVGEGKEPLQNSLSSSRTLERVATDVAWNAVEIAPSILFSLIRGDVLGAFWQMLKPAFFKTGSTAIVQVR